MTLLPGRLLRLFAVTCGIVLLFAAPSAAQERSIEIRRVAVDGHPNVTITISVTGEVSPQDIAVTENGRSLEILNVRPFIESGQEIDIVLGLDTSKSVQGSALEFAVSAAKAFVSTLPSEIRVGVLTFSDRPRVLQEITADHQAVLGTLGTIKETHPGTALYDAVTTAVGMFTGTGQHNVVLLTDGADVGSRTDLDGAVASALEKRVAVFTVGLTGPGKRNFSALETIASRTGARFDPATESDLDAIYRELAFKLSRQFVVLYRSSAPAGAQVTVGVESGGAVDSSIVLMPRLASPFETDGEGRSFLKGNLGLTAVILSSFAAVFLLVLLVVGTGTRAVRDRDLARRMAVHQTGEVQSDEAPSRRFAAWIPKPFVQAGDRVAEVGGFQSSLAQRLERAGLPMRPGELVAGSVLTALLVGLIGGLAFQSALLALGLAVLAFAGPYIWVTVKMNARIDALHAQLPDVLMILASSMRAGHSFLQALDTVSKEIGEPGGPEFARVVGEIRLGRPFDEAMTAMAERVGTEEFRWAIMALNVQREVGGNLAEILDTLADTVREREFVRRQIKVLSSEGRLSAKILTVLPFVIIGYITLVNPEYMKPLYTTSLGLVLIGAGVLLMTIGLYWVRRTTRIDV
jgi:tight adherence protein B